MTDTAGLLTPAEAQRLEGRLAERERATGAQMVIAIFQSLEGENLEDFGIRLAERWRVGQKGLDNGVILIVFAQDRKVRFEVGYGLEPVIPDAEAGRIIREAIGPRFRERRYAQGLEDAVTAVFARVENRTAPARPLARRERSGLPVLGIIVFVAIVAFIVFTRVRGRSAAYTAGRAGWGNTARRAGWAAPMVFLPPWWGSGRGGGGSWGGFSGGGGGGGFSGGGGSFGGGGASGDW